MFVMVLMVSSYDLRPLITVSLALEGILVSLSQHAGACAFSMAVDRCPTSALFHQPNLERIVNVQSRDHLFRYYNQIGTI